MEDKKIDWPWLSEKRPVGNGLFRIVLFKGEHSESCTRNEEGWICAPDCKVEDARSANPRTRKISEPVDYRIDVSIIGRFRWRWRIFLRLRRITYVNGRSKMGWREVEDGPVASGRALTRRGAHRKARKVKHI